MCDCCKGGELMTLTQQNYFSNEANQFYMSVSQFKAFEKCPASAMAEINGEYQRETSTSLLVGSFIDSYFEGEESMVNFINGHPEIFTKTNTLKAEYKQANEIIKRIERDALFKSCISGKKQVIMTGEISGVPVKIKIDDLHDDKIVDLKIVKDFENIYDKEKGSLPWFEYWEYDLQGAVYQEIVRQNTGKTLPFYLAAATKEKVTDIDIVEINQKFLDFALERFKSEAPMFDAIKKGIIEPDRCEKCEYCKITKVLTAPTEAEEFYLL
jgi:hypothetical protein